MNNNPETGAREMADVARAQEGHEPADIEAAYLRLPKWKQRFITALRLSPSVTGACQAANCSPGTAKAARENDLDFAQCWDEALDGLWDGVEEALHQEATVGATTTRRDGSVETKRDVRAMELILRAKKPAEYREKSAGITIHVGAVQDAIDQAVQSGLLTSFATRNLPASNAQVVEDERITDSQD